MKIHFRILVITSVAVLLSGCDMIMNGVDAYQRGLARGQLNSTQLAATARIGALTEVAATQRAATETSTPTKEGATPEATGTPAPEPTPTALFWVRIKTGWHPFASEPETVGEVRNTYSPSEDSIFSTTPIFGGTPVSPDLVSNPASGIIGTDKNGFELLFPVISSASGDHFRQLYLEVWVELTDLSPGLDRTICWTHSWGHRKPMCHAHLWAQDGTLIGFVEKGVDVRTIAIETVNDRQMAKVSLPLVWIDSSVTQKVE